LVNHSKEDLKPALETWLKHLEPHEGPGREYLEDFYGLGSVSYGDRGVHVAEPEDPPGREFSLLRQHLEGSEIPDEWKKLKEDDAKKLLERVESFARGLLERLTPRDTVLPHYWDKGRDHSGGCIYPENAARALYRSIKSGIEHRFSTDPVAGSKLQRLYYGSLLILESERPEELEQMKALIEAELENQKNTGEIKNISNEGEGLMKSVECFKGRLRELIDAIDSGHYLKGSCEKCMTFCNAQTAFLRR
jgi:hypothetical protein